MNTEHLGELFAAMAAARLEFGEFFKSKTANMGTYTYPYADLSDIIEATAPALAKHGLVIIQEPELVNENGQTMVVVSGCIGHKAGGIYPLKPLSLPVATKTAQAVGSAVSYARRYQLGAILNLAASDDDGQAAQNGYKPRQSAPRTQSSTPTPQNATAPEFSASDDVLWNSDEPAAADSKDKVLSQSQLARIHILGMKIHKTKEEWDKERVRYVQWVTKGAVNSSKMLQPGEADVLLSAMERKLQMQQAGEVQATGEAVANGVA